ncbi:MAG: hypothetical protein QOF99_3477, partial [Pseudonocardiales bacterium]|nr:hypothetical protein [Pseudonocardiales bacterium]
MGGQVAGAHTAIDTNGWRVRGW